MVTWSTLLEIGGFAGLVIAATFLAGIAGGAAVVCTVLMVVGFLIGDR